MSNTDQAAVSISMIASRVGTSRKTLMAKAKAKAPTEKAAATTAPERKAPAAPVGMPVDGSKAAAEAKPPVTGSDASPAPATWSSEDEAAFKALVSRRKAAGFQVRGRSLDEQLITVGTISPNSGTVVATIVEIVTGRGSVTRADLIAEMGKAVFPHTKAKPADPAWCGGYVSGAIRNGFLAVTRATTNTKADQD